MAGRGCVTLAEGNSAGGNLAGKLTALLHITAEPLTVACRIVPRRLPVDVDDGVSVVYVFVVPVMDVRPETANPAAALPAVVMDAVPVPVEVAVQPDSYRKPDARR